MSRGARAVFVPPGREGPVPHALHLLSAQATLTRYQSPAADTAGVSVSWWSLGSPGLGAGRVCLLACSGHLPLHLSWLAVDTFHSTSQRDHPCHVSSQVTDAMHQGATLTTQSSPQVSTSKTPSLWDLGLQHMDLGDTFSPWHHPRRRLRRWAILWGGSWVAGELILGPCSPSQPLPW